MPLIWGQRKAKYFLRQDWTTQISLIRLAKFDFARTRFGLSFRDGASAPDPESRDSGFDADASPRNDDNDCIARL